MHHGATATATVLMPCACLPITGCAARVRQRDLVRTDPMYSATCDDIEPLGSKESKDDGPKPSPVAVASCFIMTIPLERWLGQHVCDSERLSRNHSAIGRQTRSRSPWFRHDSLASARGSAQPALHEQTLAAWLAHIPMNRSRNAHKRIFATVTRNDWREDDLVGSRTTQTAPKGGLILYCINNNRTL